MKCWWRGSCGREADYMNLFVWFESPGEWSPCCKDCLSQAMRSKFFKEMQPATEATVVELLLSGAHLNLNPEDRREA